MNYREMVDWHRRHRADITIATIQVSPQEAERFGIAEIDADHRIVGFEEKPRHGNPARSVFNPEMVSASMGIYVFNTEVLLRLLQEDAQNPDSAHDFGKDVIPGRAGQGARDRLRFPRHQRQAGALLAGCGHASMRFTKPTWTWWR